MSLFIAAVCLFVLSSLLTLRAGRISRRWHQLAVTAQLSGLLCAAGAIARIFQTPNHVLQLFAPAWAGGGAMLRLDGLATVFLLPALLIILAGIIYAGAYWPRQSKEGAVWVRFFYALLAPSIFIVLTAANSLVFLVGWECMALCGYFLIATERSREEAQGAAALYMTATHTATLLLLALFALLSIMTDGSTTLPAPVSLAGDTPRAAAIFLVALGAFGLKAGIMPLHIWLPRAHAAAPSHVSALMSGVMIKTGIYGIMRMTTFFANPPAWWGWTLLGLGVISALLGVILALAQHDLKRLLAYHSVENIGIILIGLGTALLGASFHESALFTLGLAGSLLHVINHGLFKALLFLSGGSLIHATGSRQLAHYGGLLKALPFTGLFFLGGAVAICGLPPLNGFVSEWLVYLGLLHAGTAPANLLALAVVAAPALAMTGGLALLCFTKVFGLAFLGTPRVSPPTPCHEAPLSMLGPMALLLAACLGIGLVPARIWPLLAHGISAWRSDFADPGITLAALAPASMLTFCGLLLVLLISLLLLATAGRRESARPGTTWGCGYLFPTARMQYSTSSFAQLVTTLFQWALQLNIQGIMARGIFPARLTATIKTPDLVLDLILIPTCVFAAKLAEKIRHIIQHGIVGLYLLYSALTLVLLLILALITS